MRPIRWSPAAANDLESIRDYLVERHLSFVQPTVRRIYRAANSLREFPNRGRVGETPGTRELPLTPLPYIIVYGVEPDVVHIFRIVHGARRRV